MKYLQAHDGFRLDGIFVGLDNSIPFVPQMAGFYVYRFLSNQAIE